MNIILLMAIIGFLQSFHFAWHIKLKSLLPGKASFFFFFLKTEIHLGFVAEDKEKVSSQKKNMCSEIKYIYNKEIEQKVIAIVDMYLSYLKKCVDIKSFWTNDYLLLYNGIWINLNSCFLFVFSCLLSILGSPMRGLFLIASIEF